jgi:hypothetical protein
LDELRIEFDGNTQYAYWGADNRTRVLLPNDQIDVYVEIAGANYGGQLVVSMHSQVLGIIGGAIYRTDARYYPSTIDDFHFVHSVRDSVWHVQAWRKSDGGLAMDESFVIPHMHISDIQSYSLRAYNTTGSGTVWVDNLDVAFMTFSPDTDGDGISDESDPDDDNDGQPDSLECNSDPLDPLSTSVPNSVSGTVTANGSGIAGVIVKLLDADNPTTVLGVQETAADGTYVFTGSTPIGSYQVMVVEPLGSTTDNFVETGYLACETAAVIDFELNSVVVSNDARSKGFWKHQFDVAIDGKGQAQESAADLAAWIMAVRARYTDPFFQTLVAEETDGLGDDLAEWQELLSVRGSAGMATRAEAQVGSLAMNIMALKVGQFEVVTADGKTAGDVLTFASELLIDSLASNDELAKDLADRVNTHAVPIEAGLVTPSRNIAYKGSENPEETATAFELGQNYPNPFNPVTSISFTLGHSGRVSLVVYNSLGQEVARLVDGNRGVGQHTAVFDATGLSSGVYIYRIQTESYADTRTLTLLK